MPSPVCEIDKTFRPMLSHMPFNFSMLLIIVQEWLIGQPHERPVVVIACNSGPTLGVLGDSYAPRLPMVRIAQSVDPTLHVTPEHYDHTAPPYIPMFFSPTASGIDKAQHSIVS